MTNELMHIDVQPFNYQYLVSLLDKYRYPRNKISKLIQSKEIVPLKQGLYILGEQYRASVIPEVAANLIYGPSYISTDFALSYYSLIPEQVFNITSITTKRKKIYHTILGTFSYQSVKENYYQIAYVRMQKEGLNYLIASPEKALCDKLYLLPQQQTRKDLEELLFNNLRINKDRLVDLDIGTISELSMISGSKNLRLLTQLMEKML